MCTHDCNQGRNCNCTSTDTDAQDDLEEIAVLGVLFALGFGVLVGSVVVLLGL